jgi:hypothetical protein
MPFLNVQLDDEFVATGDRSGTTAVVAILGEDRLVVANVGDSKAILCNAGKVRALRPVMSAVAFPCPWMQCLPEKRHLWHLLLVEYAWHLCLLLWCQDNALICGYGIRAPSLCS